MPGSGDLASSIISTAASAYGSAAAYVLLERHPEIGTRFGSQALARWSRHLTERTRELSAAMLVDEPDLFAAEVGWSRAGFNARAVPVDDLRASLACLRDAVAAELPDSLRSTPDRFFEVAYGALGRSTPPAGESVISDVEASKLALEYLEAALSGRRRAAIDLVLKSVDDGLDIRDAFDDVLGAAQILAGDMWHAHEISIAQEHFVTATTEVAMSLLAHRAVSPAADDRTVVVAVAPGNAHELGAKALSLWFELDGWNTILLGSELPAAEAAGALESFEADLLAISVAMSVQLPSVLATVRLVREVRPEAKVLLGGRVFGVAPELWQKMGADGSAAGASEAVAAARRLLAE